MMEEVDNDIFRHTKGYDKKEKTYGAVYELRIRQPKEIHIYFQYVDNTYYGAVNGLERN